MTPGEAPGRRHADLVLIVDDQPDTLALLHDALDEAGHTVLVATDGASAIERARAARPDVILLDALMPGVDGFAVARTLKADPETAPIPIVFMTGLVETEHLEAAFAAGGDDYVTKPIRPREVLARIAAHTRTARVQRQARGALDAFGHATLVLRTSDGRLVWQTALARMLLREYFGAAGDAAPVPLVDWARREAAARAAGAAPQPLQVARGARRLRLDLHALTADDGAGAHEWLVVAGERDDAAAIEALGLGFGLTVREAEVLYWVTQGKTNRDIGDILGSSPRTVHKHLEHVFAKLGVETRTAAATLALARVVQLGARR